MNRQSRKLTSAQKTLLLAVMIILVIAVALFLSIGNAST